MWIGWGVYNQGPGVYRFRAHSLRLDNYTAHHRLFHNKRLENTLLPFLTGLLGLDRMNFFDMSPETLWMAVQQVALVTAEHRWNLGAGDFFVRFFF